ncbi:MULTISPECIES: hypothetical protein [Rhizobium/Agrobacterium group]|uniref:hypothetical protein n=1 Tax=Rhizobium/Agrobacterium group TaxID=227290 RepID=UPI000A4F416D|nr:hypothetical protein [Rhizobium sp. Root483D2]
MTIESRRAKIQNLIDFKSVAGRSIADDADFLALAERWVNHEIDMAEMRRLYQAVREERRRQKLKPNSALTAGSVREEPTTSSDEFLAEMARMTRSDFND